MALVLALTPTLEAVRRESLRVVRKRYHDIAGAKERAGRAGLMLDGREIGGVVQI